MIAYSLIIVNGSLHDPVMVIRIGCKEIALRCGEVRRFIRRANEVGIDAVLEQIRPNASDDRTVMRMIYEKFKDDV